MLIDSPRLTPEDRAAWDALERYDSVFAARFPAERINRAEQTIRDFAAAGPCYVSTSWGKDSTVVAHLAATSGIRLPLVWVRVKDWENPDCPAVRDAFLDQYGHLVDYHEIEVDANAPRWWDHDTHAPDTARTSSAGFAEAGRRFGARHVSGVRGEESRMRGMVMARWGDAGPAACRPIGRWTAIDVFAYLHRYDLPIHPAYAMSFGGKKDRRWLRVSSLGGIRGGTSRAAWERRYYPEIIPETGRHWA